jgi:SAM-dependent methyltransferases related to tRNA (uracil-5-)-methyltransferase
MTRVVDLEIQDVAFGGKGVGRYNGKAVFVPFVIDAETVSVRLVREHKKFIEAELETVVTTSPDRVEPPCPYFGRCGGCVYQHIDYEHQLALKWRQVKETLRRIGKAETVPMRPLIPSALQYAYRNRITVHVREGVIGFFRRESNLLLDIEVCPIASAEVNQQLSELRARRPAEGHYTLRAHPGARVFLQANDPVAASLLDLVDRLIGPSVDVLVDACCGSGFFSKRLRSRCKHVIGIDWDRHAIAAARKDAGPNEQYYAGDIDIELPRILEENQNQSLSLIVDPPATGLTETVRRALLVFPPSKVIYVSCNPGTLARDLLALKETFRCESITPLDMFPQTAEIEVTAELSARRSGPR